MGTLWVYLKFFLLGQDGFKRLEDEPPPDNEDPEDGQDSQELERRRRQKVVGCEQ